MYLEQKNETERLAYLKELNENLQFIIKKVLSENDSKTAYGLITNEYNTIIKNIISSDPDIHIQEDGTIDAESFAYILRCPLAEAEDLIKIFLANEEAKDTELRIPIVAAISMMRKIAEHVKFHLDF